MVTQRVTRIATWYYITSSLLRGSLFRLPFGRSMRQMFVCRGGKSYIWDKIRDPVDAKTAQALWDVVTIKNSLTTFC